MPLPYLNCKVLYQQQGHLFSAEVTAPYPSVGSPGTLRLYWRPNTLSSFLLIKKGDRVTVMTSGVKYDYYASNDAVLFDYAEGVKDVPVSNNIQAVHGPGDKWFIKTMPTSQLLGNSTITPTLPSGTRTFGRCFPYIREWTTAADANGIPYDVANLWALSFVPPNGIGHGTAEQDTMPVPKVIGAEYTLMTPRKMGQFYTYEQRNTFEPPDTVHYNHPSYLRFRTATSNWARDHEAAYASRYNWQARPQTIFSYSANNNPYSGGSLLTWDTVTGRISGGLAGAVPYINGVRGGQYSICGQCYDSASGNYTGFTIDVMLDDSGGAGQVLLKSIVVPGAGSTGPWTVVTGTWAGVVLPTTPGVCREVYLKCTPGIPGATFVAIFGGSGVLVSESTNVPWCVSVATGDKVAPGGLIAPFYEPY